MAKGMFAQGIAVLFEGKVDIGDVRQALQGDFRILKEIASSESWEFSGPGLLVAYRPEINGNVQVDTVHRPWPDHMGDLKNESILFGAWSMGFFGPYAYPRGLERATRQAWSWQDAREVAGRHASFVRLRLSYVGGFDDNAPVIPPGNDCQDELSFLGRLATAVLRIPGALCCFNPGGEVLRNADDLAESLAFAAQHRLPPLETWCNVRMFNLDPQWLLMDSVGNSQLDIADIEVAFPQSAFQPGTIDTFIRNLTLYVLQNPEALQDGHTVDGPNDSLWRVRNLENGLSDPPRPVIRCLPADAADVPEMLREVPADPAAEGASGEEPVPARKPWWKLGRK